MRAGILVKGPEKSYIGTGNRAGNWHCSSAFCKNRNWGIPHEFWGQVCIASMGKVKKLCMDVISNENTFIAVVFYRALRFEGI